MKRLILLTLPLALCAQDLEVTLKPALKEEASVTVVAPPKATLANPATAPEAPIVAPPASQATISPPVEAGQMATSETDPTTKPEIEYQAVKNEQANRVFKSLARKRGLDYYFNPSLDTLKVTARVNLSDVDATLKDLAEAYGLICYNNGKTLFVRTTDDLAKLPVITQVVKLKYQKADRIKKQLDSLTTPTRGSISADTKTNSLILNDTDYAVANIVERISELDERRPQISVRASVFDLNANTTDMRGVDWSKTFGTDGYPIDFGTANSLDQIFRFNTGGESGTSRSTSAIAGPLQTILRPGGISILTRFLNTLQDVNNEQRPAITLEEGDPGKIEFTDRYPIIEYEPSTNQGSTTGAITLSSKIRYKIDASDPTPTDDNPGRELGTKLYVTGRVTPDGLINLELTPRIAAISELISVPTGPGTPSSQIPRVSEIGTKVNISLLPNYTLLLGGLTLNEAKNGTTKLPVIGDIPGLGWLFKTKSVQTTVRRIVIAVTADFYNPLQSEMVQESHNKRMGALRVEQNGDSFVAPKDPKKK